MGQKPKIPLSCATIALKEGAAAKRIVFAILYHSHVIAHGIYYIYHNKLPLFLLDIFLLRPDIYTTNLLLKRMRV